MYNVAGNGAYIQVPSIAGYYPSIHIMLPDNAFTFMQLFDFPKVSRHTDIEKIEEIIAYRLSLAEFEFPIEVPDHYLNRIGLGEVYKILSESKTLRHVNVTDKAYERI